MKLKRMIVVVCICALLTACSLDGPSSLSSDLPVSLSESVFTPPIVPDEVFQAIEDSYYMRLEDVPAEILEAYMSSMNESLRKPDDTPIKLEDIQVRFYQRYYVTSAGIDDDDVYQVFCQKIIGGEHFSSYIRPKPDGITGRFYVTSGNFIDRSPGMCKDPKTGIMQTDPEYFPDVYNGYLWCSYFFEGYQFKAKHFNITPQEDNIFVITESIKDQLLQTDLDLSKTAAIRVVLVSDYAGVLLFDGEHEYFMTSGLSEYFCKYSDIQNDVIYPSKVIAQKMINMIGKTPYTDN